MDAFSVSIFEDDSPFTLEGAGKEGMLSRELTEIGKDWVRATICRADEKSGREPAKEVMELLEGPVCRDIQPHMLLEDVSLAGKLPKGFMVSMAGIAEEEVRDAEKSFQERFSEVRYSREKRLEEEALIRKKEILLNIRLLCLKEERDGQEPLSFEEAWKLVGALSDLLRYGHAGRERWEVGEIRRICGSLLERKDLGGEDWELRKKVLADIVGNRYYGSYGCGELMSELEERLCVGREESLAFADILDQSGCYGEKAAYLYHQYGKEDKYISYLEAHLGKGSKAYVDLVHVYQQQGNLDGARRVARQGLEQCRDDLTELFIYLLVDARKNGDMESYKKLYASAKRRKGADTGKIEKALKEGGAS